MTRSVETPTRPLHVGRLPKSLKYVAWAVVLSAIAACQPVAQEPPAAVAQASAPQQAPTANIRYQRTQDFDVYWQQVRKAFLETDPDGLAFLSVSVPGISVGRVGFGYNTRTVSVEDACERAAVKAYMTALLDEPVSFPGYEGPRVTGREFLLQNPQFDIRGLPRSLSDKRKVFRMEIWPGVGSDAAWRINYMLDDLDEMYALSRRAGGPARCDN